MRDFKPGDKIEVIGRSSLKDKAIWHRAKIESVLLTQIVYERERDGKTDFQFKSDFGTTWRLA